ncbi:CG42658 [Drosophila busckii]|uniref:CG42658 n=1 Tax=Drosophila busckii TaxID=30019 RepID=A0A0M4EP30_DROBS|nr:uncharacterized protein LOC108602849 [Drosophila busckii]ALC38270.1 CG42658 [Drosophila busckii]
MARCNLLIVTPTHIKFQAPFPQPQKRLFSLLNLSNRPISYGIENSNESIYQLLPESGEVAAFDTAEVVLVMQPAASGLAACCLTVRHRVLSATNEASGGTWESVRVHITLENVLEDKEQWLRMRDYNLKTKRGLETLQQQYMPQYAACHMLQLRQCSVKCNCQYSKRYLWLLLIFLLVSGTLCMIWSCCEDFEQLPVQVY